MKIITGYESDDQLGAWDEPSQGYPESPLETILRELRENGIDPAMAVSENTVAGIRKPGDYVYSGGGYRVGVPDNFRVSDVSRKS
jgi:hypothetical protein